MYSPTEALHVLQRLMLGRTSRNEFRRVKEDRHDSASTVQMKPRGRLESTQTCAHRLR